MKPDTLATEMIAAGSHPARVRGLKQAVYGLRPTFGESHPARVRGLKHVEKAFHIAGELSHPARVRGLKPDNIRIWRVQLNVAPRAGAWIETELGGAGAYNVLTSHPARVRGLKRGITDEYLPLGGSHPARVRGLKPIHYG